jgi:hypothetical protein
MGTTEPRAPHRFSRRYGDQPTPSRDSRTARVRIAKTIHHFVQNENSDVRLFYSAIEMQLGEILSSGPGEYFFKQQIISHGIEKLIDFVEVAFTFTNRKIIFRNFINKIFAEEALTYHMNENGEIYFFPDHDFAVQYNVLIRGLDSNEFTFARDKYESCLKLLRDGNLSQAIDDAFTSVESVFKVITGADGLKVNMIRDRLSESLGPVNVGNEQNKIALSKVYNSMGQWVDACHNYRHAPGTADPLPPPEELAILLISQASSYLRWLLDIHAKQAVGTGGQA